MTNEGYACEETSMGSCLEPSCALLLAAAPSLTMSADVAGATTNVDPNCTGYGGISVLDAAYIYNRTTGVRVRSVQLCERWVGSNGDRVFWTWVTLFYTMRSGDHANGALRVFLDSHGDEEMSWSPRTCSDPGGTGLIIAPDRTCASKGASRFDVLRLSIRADAYIYNANGTIIAAGATSIWTILR